MEAFDEQHDKVIDYLDGELSMLYDFGGFIRDIQYKILVRIADKQYPFDSESYERIRILFFAEMLKMTYLISNTLSNELNQYCMNERMHGLLEQCNEMSDKILEKVKSYKNQLEGECVIATIDLDDEDEDGEDETKQTKKRRGRPKKNENK